MIQLIKMAWRNLWRNKVRSLAVMVAVVIGLVAGMFASALVEGIMSSRFTNFIENQVSHLQLHHPDFIREREVQQFIVGPTLPLQDVQGREGIAAATTRTKLQGMVASASYTGMVELVGILPESENRTTNFARHMVAGEYLSDQVSNSILIGAALAAKLKVGIGSRIVLSYQDLENQLVSGAFIVSGIFDSGYSRYDEVTAFVPQQYLNASIGMGAAFHELAIVLEDMEQLPVVQQELRHLFPETSVRAWYELEPALQVMMESSGLFSYIFLVLIMIGLAFSILNTMLMAVFERTREIGMLMAIGMRRSKVFLLITLETFFLSLSGALIGLAIGFAWVLHLSRRGLDLSRFHDVMRELGVDSVIFPTLSPEMPYLILGIVMLTALFAALYPALKALALSPIEAIRK